MIKRAAAVEASGRDPDWLRFGDMGLREGGKLRAARPWWT